MTVSGVSGGHGLRRKPMGTAKRLQTTVAILAVVMLFASLLAVAQRSDFLESIAEAPTRDLVNPADTLTSAEAALLEQLARVGDGITLDSTNGATASLDGRFMLAGAAFETDNGSSFSVVTSSWMGTEITRAAEPVLEGDRVVYAHDGLTEWWVRNGRGYEQGWTVDAPPADGSTDLTLDIIFEGAATTQLSPTTVELILGDGSRAWYRNLHAFDAEGTTLPAYLSTQGSQVTVTVEAEGAVYPVTIDPILSQDQELIPPDSTTGDLFGEAVATDGDLMIVSVRGSDQNVADRGRAEIYKWDGTNWNYQDTLVNPVTESTDFGWAVDINVTAGFAVVGSPGDDTNGVDSGAAYVFVDNNNGTWSLKDTLYECNVSLGGNCGTTADGTFDGNQFGRSVSMSDNARVAVGAPAVSGAQGVVYVYEELPAAGSSFQTNEDRTLKGSTSGDRFGEATAIAAGGDYLVVGAPGTTVAGNADAGEVTLASFTGGVWTIDDTDIGPNNSAGKEYGASVAIADVAGGIVDYLVVAGLPQRTRFDDAGTGFTGVRVMSFTTAGLSLSTVGLGDISSPTSDTAMGFSVATDGVNVIVGEPFNSGLNAPERGLVRVFTYLPAGNTMDNGGAGASAAQQNLPVDWAPPIADGVDRYGYSVAVGPQTGVTGPYVTGIPNWVSTTPRRSPQTGRVATASAAVSFAPNVGETTLLTQSPDKTAAALDRLGFAVAISGNRMAASAIGDDERQSQNGLVYTYERANEGALWTLDQLIVDPTPTDDAKPFGHSLDMEGDFLAIGSPGGNGQVDVFALTGGVWAARPSVVGNPAENLANDLDFGHDVAISTDGDVLAVSILGYDYAGGQNDRGAVRIYDWNGTNYVERVLLDDGTALPQVGISIDMDEIPGSNDMRLVLGSNSDSMVIYTVDDGIGGGVGLDDFFDGPDPGTESVAIDNDRIAAVSYTGGTDELWVIDRQADGDWTHRVLFSGVLFNTAPTTLPNNLVDVSGDTIVVGLEDELVGGEVAVYFNDPTYGWGTESALAAWADGAVDAIVPTVQQPSHRIGRAVAIDGAGATKSIVFGADGRDTNGVDAGVVYAKSRLEAGNTPAPTNKIVPPDFTGFSEGQLGKAISIGESAWGVGGVVAQDRQVHRVEPAATGWEIVQTFDYFSDVVDVDFDAANGTMVVLLQNGDLWAYEEDACGAAADCSFSPRLGTPAIDVGTVNTGSVAIAGTDVIVAIVAGFGDQFQQLIDFGDGGNAPVGAPAGVVAADLFGTSMDASGTTVAIGAPGADTNDGRVYIWDAAGLSFTHTIDSTVGPGTAGRFGNSVALEGDTLVVGVPSFDADGSVDGVVEIVDIAAGAITPIDTLIPSGGSGLSGWGQSVDIDGSTLVIGGSGFEQGGIPYRHGAAVAYGFDGAAWVETDNFTASDFASADQAGFAVGVVGTDVLVGANLDDNTQGENAGAVYAYTATPVDVGPANRLLANDAASSAFGRHIDIDGSVAVITEHNGGAMQIYDLVGSDWVFRQRIDGFAESVRDVSIDGTRIAVIDRIGNELFLFEETGGTFAAFATRSIGNGVPESVKLDGDDIFIGLLSSAVDLPLEHHFWAGGLATVPTLAGSADAGWSIAKDGDLVFVGARFWDDAPDDNAGRVHIYDTSTQTWTGIIVADQAGTLFGSDIEASNGRLVVGYQGGEGPDPTGPNPTDFTGIAEVYNNLTPTGGDLEQILTGSNQDIADSFGRKVDIDGDLIAIGAPATSYNGARRGQVVMFAFDGASFVEAETFRSNDDSTGTDQFGHDVALDGFNVIAGAYQHDNARGTSAGAAYYFTSAGVPVVDDPALTFSLDLGPGSPASVAVAPAGIAVSEFNRSIVEGASDNESSIAAASLGETDLEASPLSALPIADTPLSALAADDQSIVSTIPLIEITIDGGWESLLDGTELSETPLVDLTLGDVADDATALSRLESTPLSALDVDGTPLSALPLSALALGSLPLSALPQPDGTTWCDILVPDYVTGTCAEAESLTLFEATLTGVPLSALPLSALPLSALPLSALPLSALPLSALDLDSTPLSALPLSALPLSALDVNGTPLSALPLSALPLSALDVNGTPLSALPLSALELNGTPLSALPLSALPLSALEVRNVPLSALQVEGAPLSALPLSALPLSALVLADTPLSALPLSALDTDYTDWCDLLSDLDAGYDCTNGVDDATFLAQTTIADLGVRGVPLSALPLSALPLSALGLADTPLSALPLSALPLSALPLSALPLSALTVNGTPLSALPLSALDVQGSPLSALPLSALPLSALPLSALPLSALPLSALDLNGTPLSALPLSALDIDSTPLSALPLSALPLSALNQVDCDLADCGIDSLNDAIVAGALDPASLTLADLQAALGGIRLGEISESITTATEQDVIDAIANAALTMDDLSDLDDLRLGELPADNVDLGAVTLADIEAALWSVRLSDLVGTILDPATGQPLANVEADLLADVAGFTFGDWNYLGTATLGELLQAGDGGEFFSELGPILGLIHVRDLTGITAVDELLGDADLGDLTLLDLFGQGIVDPNSGENIDDLLLGDLLTGADDNDLLEGFTITDLLLALLGIDPVQFSGLDFTEIESGQLPEDAVPPASFAAMFEVTGTDLDKSVEVEILIPATATYIPGTGSIDTGAGPEPLEPTIGENALIWTLTDVSPDTETTIGFDVRPTVTIGATSLSGSALIVGSDIDAAGTAVVAVTEGSEPNDFPDVVTAVEDTVYLTYISTETDNDVFSITLAEGDELAIQLSSLSSDLDFAVYARPTDPGAAAALSGASDEAPITPITNPDQTESEAEPVNDFRRLDLEDPTLDLLGVSNASGTENELFVTEALPAGDYFIQVYGANGATNVEPAALQIQVLEAEVRPDCANVGAGTVTGAIGTDQLGPAGANTVFLVNQQRMDHYYGQDGLDTVTAVKDFASWLNGPNGPAGVTASVISVDSYGAVDAAYDAWDADSSCSPESANGVVAAINGVVDGFRGDLEHLVVVGGDPIVPMARLLDETSIANEYDFRYEFVGDNVVGADPDQINALSATFWDRTYLSDEPYGETAARDLGNRFLYVSDIALGRLVETPTEIQGMLSHFENFDGQLDAQTAAVLGYDFLVDSSEQIAADLADPALGITVDDELADGTDAGGALWDRDDAADRVVPAAGDAPDLISLNGHFDHYRALPANGDKVPGFNENFLADTVLNEISVAPSILQGSIVFSMGCHGGLSVSDLQIGDAGDNTNGDWAQTFASDQAIFLGNTGFGYGDTEAVAYTEALLARFAELAVRPTDLGAGQQTTVGQALTFAKNDYAADLSVFSVYDEKALMEMTFYGLPFYTIDLGTVDAPPVPDNTTAPDATGIETLGVNADPSNDVSTEDRGTFWSNPDESGDPQTIVTPGRPIQPSLTTDVSVVDPNDSTALDRVAHGALILGMDSTYQSPVNPVIAAVVVNESEDSPEPDIGDVVFPAKPVTINTSTTAGGQRQSLVLATGQFDSNGSTQRLDDNINAVVYYSDPAETDFDAPTIGVVESNFDPVSNLLTVTLTASDSENDVVRVYVLVAGDPGAGSVTWTGIDLVQTPGTDEWSGSLSLPGSTVEFLIQAVDSAGNVGFATNKARNFVDDGTEEPEPPAPDLTVTVPAAGPEGWYTGPVTVTVDSGDLDATFEISPGTASTPIAGGGFTIDGQGVFEWTVTASDGQTASGNVRIDSTAPSATLAPPEDGASYEVSQVPAVGFSCTDPSLQTCVATVTGPGGTAAINQGDALPTDVGNYTVTVVATDVFNNVASDAATYTVVADPLDDLVVTVSPVNLDIGSGLYTGDVDVIVETDADVEYTLNGGTPVTITAPGDTFTITAEEVTEWVVTRPADGAEESGSVEIDTTAPTATLDAPVDGAVFTPGSVPPIDFECTDRNLSSCVATVDGTPILLGDALPDAVGTYDIEITGTDVVGLETTASGTYTVEVTPGDPIVVTDIEIDGVAEPGEPVDIWGSFVGGVAPYSIDVDWGDGGTCADGTCAIEAPTVADDGMFDAGYIYPVGGAYTVTVTITDAAGSSIVETLTSATCTITGTNGRDVLRGTTGDDVICGFAGNDRLYGRGGNDIIFGGSGRDRLYGQNGDDILFGGRDNDILYGSFGDDEMSGGRGVDTLIAGDGNDILKGRQDNDWMYGQNHDDTLIGNRGNDRMFGGTGDDIMDGRRGNDRMYGQAGNDTMDGGNGNDLMYGGNNNDIMNGQNGDDDIYGGRGNDTIDGGEDADLCRGNNGSDTLVGCEF